MCLYQFAVCMCAERICSKLNFRISPLENVKLSRVYLQSNGFFIRVGSVCLNFFKSDQKKSKMFACCWCWAGKDSIAVTSGFYLLTTLLFYSGQSLAKHQGRLSRYKTHSAVLFPVCQGRGLLASNSGSRVTVEQR